MSKKYLWRLQTIMMAAMMSVGFTSCCCDKDIIPSTSTGDGLEGYWLEDLYKVKTETANGVTPEAVTQETWVFDDTNPCNLIYLDGQGGGTYFYMICTEERRNSSEEYQEKFPNKVGTFKDFQENTHTYYGYKQEAIVYFQRGSTIVIAMNDTENPLNVGNQDIPLDDLNNIIGNTTIGDILGNTTVNDAIGAAGNSVILKNFVDGGIPGYHKATKVQ